MAVSKHLSYTSVSSATASMDEQRLSYQEVVEDTDCDDIIIARKDAQMGDTYSEEDERHLE